MKRVHDFTWFSVRWLARYGWIVARTDAIVVVPEGPEDTLWMIRIHRKPTGERRWELPGGGCDGGEDAVSAALRELQEECGLVAKRGGRLLPTTLEAAPGMGRLPHRVVVARGVTPLAKTAEPQIEEGIDKVARLTRAQVQRLIRRGEISALPTLGALAVTGWV